MPFNRSVIASRRVALALALAVWAVPAGAQEARLPVVASFSILADLARAVGGEKVTVTSLVGPNADAHVYRATPADAKSLAAARVVVANGLGFEGFLPRLIKSSGTKAVVVTASKGIRTLEARKGDGHGHGHTHGHKAADPHAWQSVEAVKIYVANIRDGLKAAAPADSAYFQANAERYLATLDALATEIRSRFEKIPAERRIVLTSHDAFGYFAREFGVTMEAVQGVSTESEPSAKDIARIVRLAKAKKARAVFVENMTDPRIGEQLARETGARLGGTLFSDALSDEKGPAATYIDLLRHNATAIAAALGEG